MRLLKKLAIFILASLITFGLGVTINRLGPATARYFSEPSAWQVLLSFENQDLAGLDEQSVRVIQRAIDTTTGPVDTTRSPRFEPRLFKRLSNSTGEPRYILVEESPIMFIPGSATIRAHIFDTAGKVLSGTEFSAGNRIFIISMGIRKNYWFNSEVLRLDGEYYLSNHSSHQYYMVVGNQLKLVYSEIDGNLRHNDYQEPRLTIGPRLNMSADDWESDLQSNDIARILSALMWLGGHHWNGEAPPYDEDRADAEKVTNLRERESVRRRLADLTNSTNFFVKSAAEEVAKR